jgi:hypothetical protein
VFSAKEAENEVLAEGNLLKKSAWIGRWDKRFFELRMVDDRHAELVYWLTATDRRNCEPARGSFVIRSNRRHRGPSLRLLARQQHEYAMEVRVAPSVRSDRAELDAWPVLQVAALNADDCDRWMVALTHAYSVVEFSNRITESPTATLHSRSPSMPRAGSFGRLGETGGGGGDGGGGAARRSGRSASFSAFRSASSGQHSAALSVSRRSLPTSRVSMQSPLVPAQRAAPLAAQATTQSALSSASAAPTATAAAPQRFTAVRLLCAWRNDISCSSLRSTLALWLALALAQGAAALRPELAALGANFVLALCHAALVYRVVAALRAAETAAGASSGGGGGGTNSVLALITLPRAVDAAEVLEACVARGGSAARGEAHGSGSGGGGGDGDGGGGALLVGLNGTRDVAAEWRHPRSAAEAETLWRKGACGSRAASRSHALLGTIYNVRLGLPRRCFDQGGALHECVRGGAAHSGGGGGGGGGGGVDDDWKLSPTEALAASASAGWMFRIAFCEYTSFFVSALSAARIGRAFEASMRMLAPGGDVLAEERATRCLLRRLESDSNTFPDRCVAYLVYTPPVDVGGRVAGEAGGARLSMLSSEGMQIDVRELVRSAGARDGAVLDDAALDVALASAASTISRIYLERTVDGLGAAANLNSFLPFALRSGGRSAVSPPLSGPAALARFAAVWRDDPVGSDSLDAFLQLMGVGFIARKSVGLVVSTVSVLVVGADAPDAGDALAEGAAAAAAAAASGEQEEAGVKGRDPAPCVRTLVTRTETALGDDVEAYVLDGEGRAKRPKKASAAQPEMRVTRTGRVVAAPGAAPKIVCTTYRPEENWTIQSTRRIVGARLLNEMTVTLHTSGESATARRFFKKVRELDAADHALLVAGAVDPQWSWSE